MAPQLTEAQLYNLGGSSGPGKEEIKCMFTTMMVNHLYEVHHMGIREIHKHLNLPMKEIKRILNLSK